MLINNPEALKCWLIVVLEPLCDADSAALARYVLALLKKDKPEKELKEVMIEQLDVFLGDETAPFVKRLFGAINSEEYLVIPAHLPPPPPPAMKQHMASDDGGGAMLGTNAMHMHDIDAISPEMREMNMLPSTVAPTSNNAAAAAAATNTTTTIHKNMMPTTHIVETRTKDAPCNFKASDAAEIERATTTANMNATTHHHTHTHASVYSVSGSQHPQMLLGTGSSSSSVLPTRAMIVNAADKENQPRESRRRRASLRSRSRSRSRSNERSRRSRSRDRRMTNNGDRDKGQRQFRNKSPPPLEMRHDRRRGVAGGAVDRRNRVGGGGAGVGISGSGGGGGAGGSANDERSPRFGGASGGGGSGSGGGGGGSSSVGGSGNNASGSLDGGRKMRSNRSHSRSRSLSAERLVRQKSSPERHQAGQVQPEGEKRQRCRDFDEKGYCVRGETCPWDHGVNPVVFEDINNAGLISISLREYNPDAPDLWSRAVAPGSMVAGGGVGGINPFTGTPRPGGAIMMGVGAPNAVGFQHLSGGGGVVVEKLPNGAGYARSTVAGTGFPTAAAPLIPFPFNPVATPLPRELIPIPVVDANASGCMAVGSGGVGGDIGATMQQQQGKRRFELEDTVAIADGPTKRKLPLNSRLGPRISNMQSNCSLELRKVPRGLNTIAHLNNHFAKFGKIVNIQISYDGDPEAAIVTFSTHAEANVAYRSTEAVLNNRFIKVFWHTADVGPGLGLNDGGHMSMVGGMGGRKSSSHYHLNNVPAVPTPAADSAKIANTAVNASASSQGDTTTGGAGTDAASAASHAAGTTNANSVAATHVPNPSLRLKNNVARGMPTTAGGAATIRKKQEEQAKAVVQLANGLRKRKQELLQSYVKQMKSALELVERCDPHDAQRAKTLETIKALQENIDKMRKEIAAEQEQIQARIQNNQVANAGGAMPAGQLLPPTKKNKEQQKKELLDIELELFAQQQEGNDTSAIQRRLEDLQRSLGIVPSSGGGGMTIGGGIGSAGGVGGLAGGVGGGGGKPAPHFMGNHRVNARGGRSAFPEGSTRVDRRPKTIVVTGFTSEEADFVLGHFKHFGEISKHDLDKEIPQLILSYATRINAEQAVLRGKIFKDKRLQISWAPTVTPKLNKPNTPIDDSKLGVDKLSNADILATSPLSGQSKSLTDLDLGADTLPELRLEDEEEDDECEDRSWRR